MTLGNAVFLVSGNFAADDQLFLAGSLKELGLWRPEDAVPLRNDPAGSRQWVGTLQLPTDVVIEWKVLKKSQSGKVSFENGENRRVTLPNKREILLRAEWNSSLDVQSREVPVSTVEEVLGGAVEEGTHMLVLPYWSTRADAVFYFTYCLPDDTQVTPVRATYDLGRGLAVVTITLPHGTESVSGFWQIASPGDSSPHVSPCLTVQLAPSPIWVTWDEHDPRYGKPFSTSEEQIPNKLGENGHMTPQDEAESICKAANFHPMRKQAHEFAEPPTEAYSDADPTIVADAVGEPDLLTVGDDDVFCTSDQQPSVDSKQNVDDHGNNLLQSLFDHGVFCPEEYRGEPLKVPLAIPGFDKSTDDMSGNQDETAYPSKATVNGIQVVVDLHNEKPFLTNGTTHCIPASKKNGRAETDNVPMNSDYHEVHDKLESEMAPTRLPEFDIVELGTECSEEAASIKSSKSDRGNKRKRRRLIKQNGNTPSQKTDGGLGVRLLRLLMTCSGR